jgi:hypothetical protein
MNSTLYLIAETGFVVLTIIYFALFIRELNRGVELTEWDPKRKIAFKRNWIIGLLVWGIFVSVWSGTGVMRDFTRFPFNFFPVIVVPLIAILFVTFSRSMTQVLASVKRENIIRLQSFRLFVEILLWVLFVDNVLPVQMTFEGRNFDVLSGITAPIIAWLAAREKISRPLLIGWNIICLLLLINIVTIAILSTPSPVRVFMNEPANTAVAYFPISWLPGFLVPLAYTLHFFSLKQLLAKR